MATNNPYPIIGSQLTAGMDSIPPAVTTPTVDELVDAVYAYIQPVYYPGTPSTQTQLEIRSVIYNMINAYNNRLLWQGMYNTEQYAFIDFMIGRTTTDLTPIDALDNWLSEIESTISESGLSLADQAPLWLAIEVGRTIYTYWTGYVATPGTIWDPFWSTDAAINYASIPLWSVAAIEGALLGANGSQQGLIAPTTDIVSVEIISALIGALTIGAGKLIFKWTPSIIAAQLEGGFSPAVGGLIDDEIMTSTDNVKCTVNNCVNTCTNWGCTATK